MATRQLRKVTRRPMLLGVSVVHPVDLRAPVPLCVRQHDQHRTRQLRRLLMPGIIVMTAILGRSRRLRLPRTSPRGWITDSVAPDRQVGRARRPHRHRSGHDTLRLAVMLLIGLLVGFRPPARVSGGARVRARPRVAYVSSWIAHSSACRCVTPRPPSRSGSSGSSRSSSHPRRSCPPRTCLESYARSLTSTPSPRLWTPLVRSRSAW